MMAIDETGTGFLGKGWKLPVTATKEGKIVLATGEESIREAVWIILATAPGERPMRPEFGCGIHDLVFAPNSAQTAGRVAAAVREALARWEPRIGVETVDLASDPDEPGRLLIQIEYRVRLTNSRFNLVYPFYLEGR
ncbi:MAG TPA: GPW/gp25 family protein [Thermoanaerobaculia bacterium]|nr:GPW/gp25 family protein [Thermoanaerobaculia bacterium]